MKYVWFLLVLVGCFSIVAHADISDSVPSTTQYDPVQYRNSLEQKEDNNPFSITFYQPTYILPFYYSAAPDPVYARDTPDQQTLQNVDFKFQFSLKTPIWENFFGKKNALYLAYTQLSYWQAYNQSPFFRETNYEPELFLANNVDKPLWYGWRLQFINMGAAHQSNGRGGDLERSWNRVYLDTIFSRNNWMISIKPWYVISDHSLRMHNPDITHYLGHGRLLIAYKRANQTWALETYNLTPLFNRGSAQLTWSFPLVKKLKGYVQGFSGYGQSLIEYNHRTNSIGVGIALSDWV